MKPTIGRTVIVQGIYSNGATMAPGVITRVWGDGDPATGTPVRVNLTVFPDNDVPTLRSSIALCETREQAHKLQESVVAHWPERA